jgi:hypothetical protein
MRKMLLIVAAGVGLFLGRAGAEAVTVGDEVVAPSSAFDGQLVTANLIAPAMAGGLAFTIQDGRSAVGARPVMAAWAVETDREAGVHTLVLVAIAGVVAGLGAAGAIAVRMLEEREVAPGGMASQPPSGLLHANLAYLDGLMVGHPARGTSG